MKALTICQPFAHLVLPEAGARVAAKLVENREWYTSYRGPLLIHAGKSRQWLRQGPRDGRLVDMRYNIAIDDMVFGAIVGVAQLVECANIDHIEDGKYDDRYPWLWDHEHTEGTFCWVLENAFRFAKPIPYTGRQGLFEIPTSLVQHLLPEGLAA